MPALKRPESAMEVDLRPRRALRAERTEVLVVGGGPAGIGAAMGAAQAGARVVLAERYGFLGGNATAALVMPLMSFHTQKGTRRERYSGSLLPSDHGPGDPAIAGALAKFLHRLIEAGGAIPPSLETGYVVPFDPEIFKIVALQMLDELGVDLLLHAFASDVWGGSSAEGAVFETKSGPVVVPARIVVDCSGDADIAARAGAECEIGRPGDGLVQPMTLSFRLVQFQQQAFEGYVRDHPDQWLGVRGLWDLVREATRRGELNLAREDILLFGTPHPGEVSVNSTRVVKVLGVDVWDLSYAECESRRQMDEIVRFLRKRVPGFEDAYLVQSGTTIGVRETRRIVGDHRLSAEDVLMARKFDDAIAQGAYPIDIHNPEGKGTVLRRVAPGEAYQIPLGCLLPRGVDNLLVAGRAISGSHEAHSSYRVMPICIATGHAAGVCAALAAAANTTPRDIDVREVQRELRRQGAVF